MGCVEEERQEMNRQAWILVDRANYHSPKPRSLVQGVEDQTYSYPVMWERY